MSHPTDPRTDALKHLARVGGSLSDSLTNALGCHRADGVEADRDAAVTLCLRRAERLARDLLAAIPRVPR